MSEADLAQAELELGYTIVRSPLSGHISERNVDLGTPWWDLEENLYSLLL